MMSLSRYQQHLLAADATAALADVAERAHMYPSLAEVPARDIRAQLARWARLLPGDAWDDRLGPRTPPHSPSRATEH